MAFNFMAALGGFGRQVANSIESENQFNREKKLKLELLAEEEATKMRLARSADRKSKQQLLEQVTAGLSYFVSPEDASAIVKTYGPTQAKMFLQSLGEYEGDISTALKLPEIKNGVYGSQLITNATDGTTTTGSVPTLGSLLPKVTEPKDTSTEWKWVDNWLQEELELNQLPDGDEKTKRLADHQQKLDAYYAVSAKKKAAEESELLNVKSADRIARFGTGTNESSIPYEQRQSAMNRAYANGFNFVTGMTPERADAIGQKFGSNIESFASLKGMNDLFKINENGTNDGVFSNEIKTNFSQRKEDLKTFAQNTFGAVVQSVETKQDADGKPVPFKKSKNLTGFMTKDQFMAAVTNGAGELKPAGIYLLKNEDGSLDVVTYLGFENVFSKNKLNYLPHFTVKVGESMLNTIEQRYGN